MVDLTIPGTGIGRRTPRAMARQGFSLLELVIVIALITALLALALPALRGAHMRSKKTTELSRLRQVGMAWHLYAGSSNDSALPGFIEPDVQTTWEVTYGFPDVLGGDDPRMDDLSPETAAPWTWRLASYLNDGGRIFRAHLDEQDDTPLEMFERAGTIATEPGFGYNGFYVGGYWAMTDGPRPRPNYRFAAATDQLGRRVNVVARSPSSIQKSADLVVFCSTTERSEGRYLRSADDAAGFHLAVPPILADMPQWSVPGEPLLAGGTGGAQAGSGDAYSVEALTHAPTPLGRYTGAAAVYFADGHVDALTPVALADQTRWIPGASQVGDAPASRFTHSDD